MIMMIEEEGDEGDHNIIRTKLVDLKDRIAYTI